MTDETKDKEEFSDITDDFADSETLSPDDHSEYTPSSRFDASAVRNLGGMYRNWFLDYASYVILERAVPNIDDGLKPVQRRILHSMKRMDDGRFNKVANIVGHTMQFHPHGDASIGDALVQLGQKELLVDTQGNWGNILTGDRAAAPRYIEARLTKFALDVVFNPKTTQWQLSYDGRNREPVTLPVKFPLLLAQGAEGIAVGLSSKILPHNFNEICDAAIHYLRGEPFALYPDFPTGGSIDVSKYNGGARGGTLRVRAKIEKLDKGTLVIREIPFSKTTSTLIDSILKAVEKGKIKARRVDDNTASEAEIQVHLMPGVSSDKAIDALYAFTDCEISLSPNCCVIEEQKPCFLSVDDVLRHCVDRTVGLLRHELEIRRAELTEQLFFASLEKIFIEERIYKEKAFEQAPDLDSAISFVDKCLEPFKPSLVREVTHEDILRLLEIKMQRILKFNKDKAEDLLRRIKAEIKEVDRDLKHMTEVTIKWFEYLKEKYGASHPRRTIIRNFDTIEAAKVAEANQKLYINRQEGFIGTSLKKDEFVCNCSDIDDIIVFSADGKYKIIRVKEKIFVGKNIRHVQVFKRNDQHTIYNAIYRNGRQGYYYAKRFNVTSVTRDKEYDLTQGEAGSRVVWFSANPDGGAEVLRITLETNPRIRRLSFDYDFSVLAVKGRSAKGNLLSKSTIHRISLKSRKATPRIRSLWFDTDTRRINYDALGTPLGDFGEDDRLLVILQGGEYYFSDTDPNNHFEDNILFIEKYDAEKVWTAVYKTPEGLYLKRFTLQPSKKRREIAPDLLFLTGDPAPRLRLTLGPYGASRKPLPADGALEVDAEQHVGVKSVEARGKRLTTLSVLTIEPVPTNTVADDSPELPSDDTSLL